MMCGQPSASCSAFTYLACVLRRSLGSGPTWPTQGPQAALNAALNNLALAGLVVIVSAGNDGGLGSTALGMCVPD